MKEDLTKKQWKMIIESVMPFADRPADAEKRAIALASLTQEDRDMMAQMVKRINSTLIDAEKKGLNPPDVSEYVKKNLLK